jgi:hypothetical protein
MIGLCRSIHMALSYLYILHIRLPKYVTRLTKPYDKKYHTYKAQCDLSNTVMPLCLQGPHEARQVLPAQPVLGQLWLAATGNVLSQHLKDLDQMLLRSTKLVRNAMCPCHAERA